MGPKQVYERHEAFKSYDYTKFRNNLYGLRKVIAREFKRMREDCEAYGHDRAIVNGSIASKPVPWHRSPAANLLQLDVKANLHLRMQPKELWATRDEYKAFELKVFRKHLCHERDREQKKAFRKEKKKKKLFMNVNKDANTMDASKAHSTLGI